MYVDECNLSGNTLMLALGYVPHHAVSQAGTLHIVARGGVMLAWELRNVRREATYAWAEPLSEVETRYLRGHEHAMRQALRSRDAKLLSMLLYSCGVESRAPFTDIATAPRSGTHSQRPAEAGQFVESCPPTVSLTGLSGKVDV